MKRYKSHDLLAHEALIRNLRRKKGEIYREYYKKRAGFTGEKQLDYRLSFLSDDYMVLPDIRLRHPIGAFQIDALVLTRKVLFILESKYLNGLIEYRGDVRQLVQNYEGREQTYKDPILQANIQRKQLEKWLAERGYHIPIVALAISTNEYATIEMIGEKQEFLRYFTTLENILFKLETIYDSFDQEILMPVDLQRLVHAIHQEKEAKYVDILEEYRIQPRDLFFGIRCENCNNELQRNHSTWCCPHCSHTQRDAHLQKIYDYFLLIGDTITNEQCRVWLGLQDRHVVKRILKSMKLESEGNRRHKKYKAPKLHLFPQTASIQSRNRS